MRWLALACAAVCAPLALAAPASGAQDAPFHAWRVQPGDTLIGLGQRLLADPSRWPELARENGLRNANRIAVGSTLRIPLALLRSEVVPARVLDAGGDVPAGAPPAATTLGEGQPLSTGAGATVRLVDGTVLRLRPGASVVVREARRYPDVGAVRSAVDLREGRIEVRSPSSAGGQPGFEVRTPQGVLGVRGTSFRVAADAAGALTRGEVLEGAVVAAGAAGSQRVGASFGTVIDSAGRVAAPVELLAAPDVSRLPPRQERPLVRFEWPALHGAAGYRAQLAGDASFERVVSEQTLDAPLLRLSGLPDGSYVLRLRGADTLGIEGRNADHAFVLKARPEPPLTVQPAPGAVVMGGVVIRWAAGAEAASYRLELARDAAMTDLVLARDHIAATQLDAGALAPGSYHWRVRSVRADGDAGPWGDAVRFDLKPLPPPSAPPHAQAGDTDMRLSWPAQPGQQFDVEVARDAAFTDLVLTRRLAGSGLSFSPPTGGRYHVRLRTIEADGYVGPYSAAQYVDLPHCLRTEQRACVRALGEPVLALP